MLTMLRQLTILLTSSSIAFEHAFVHCKKKKIKVLKIIKDCKNLIQKNEQAMSNKFYIRVK